MQAGIEIALLGPAHVTNGIILSSPFISRIVPARAIRSGEPKLQFLLVKQFPGQLDFSNADVYEAASISQSFRRLLDGFVALACSTNNREIGAVTVCPDPHFVGEILLARNDDSFRSDRLG